MHQYSPADNYQIFRFCLIFTIASEINAIVHWLKLLIFKHVFCMILFFYLEYSILCAIMVSRTVDVFNKMEALATCGLLSVIDFSLTQTIRGCCPPHLNTQRVKCSNLFLPTKSSPCITHGSLVWGLCFCFSPTIFHASSFKWKILTADFSGHRQAVVLQTARAVHLSCRSKRPALVQMSVFRVMLQKKTKTIHAIARCSSWCQWFSFTSLYGIHHRDANKTLVCRSTSLDHSPWPRLHGWRW